MTSTEEEFHQCHFCGEYVRDGKDPKGERHWLSDCRPDLVKHEIGDTCTWGFRRNLDKLYKESETCYAYQNFNLDGVWTDKHENFYEDGPM